LLGWPPRELFFEIRRADAPSLNYPDVVLFSLGLNDAINADLSGIGDIEKWLEAKGVDSAVRQLIEIETADRPDEVGPPIALVEITKSGVLWGSDGKCGPS
jgi:lysophospholipase L1-like esterase